MRRLSLALLLALLSAPAWAIDGNTLGCVTSTASVATCRAALINEAWGIGTGVLPSTLPTVTTGVTNPYGGSSPANVASVDSYVSAMSNAQTYTSLLYHANSPNNGRVVIVNMGHQDTCDWPSFSAVYNTTQLLVALLNAGYSVFAYNMPRPPTCGVASDHTAMFASFGNTAMQYFLEPLVEAENYWDAHRSFSRYDMVGLSGGGWTTTVMAALDPRIQLSIPDAGSMPGINQNCLPADAEQTNVPFYTIAGYLDMYLMASYPQPRRQVQILGISDDCCFGPTQWVSGSCASSHGGQDWYTYTLGYVANLRSGATTASFNPEQINYTLLWDYTATAHQISVPWADNIILNALASAVGGHR